MINSRSSATDKMHRNRALRPAGDVVALLGGLGNQLFQVAFGRWLGQHTGRETRYDVSFHRDLHMDACDVPRIGDDVRRRLLTRTRRWPTPDGRASVVGRVLRMAHGPSRLVRDYTGPGLTVPTRPASAWWFGYWQRAEYAQVLLPELSNALEDCAPDEADTDTAIGIHVRRGDMLGTQSAVPAAWFGRALERLKCELGGQLPLPVRLWSDDPEWCRRELDLGVPFEVTDEASPIEHLAALAHCRALVVSRSTFSWWAAAVASGRGVPIIFPCPWWGAAPHLDAVVIPGAWLPVSVSGSARTSRDGRSLSPHVPTREG